MRTQIAPQCLLKEQGRSVFFAIGGNQRGLHMLMPGAYIHYRGLSANDNEGFSTCSPSYCSTLLLVRQGLA
jgi:hypothetical protein